MVLKLRVSKFKSEVKNELPDGAKRYKGHARKTLNALRAKDIDFYEKTSECINGGAEYLRTFGVIESTFYSLCRTDAQREAVQKFFPNECSPTINSVGYYRGLAVPIDGGAILIYTPHMQPWIPKQRKETFDLYTLGNVLDEKVEEVVTAYSERMGKHIDRVLYRRENEPQWGVINGWM